MIGTICHVCNRGVKKHDLFLDEKDYFRFVLNLYRLNNRGGSLRITNSKNPFNNLPKQDKLVEILKWSLMKNHYHLLLYEKVEGGVVEFTKRIGNAYTKYWNIKNSSSGYVFQNAAKIIPIEKDAHYLYIPFYIDLNPVRSSTKQSKHKEVGQAISFLKNYPWSSYRDYFGNKSSFSAIVNEEVFYDNFDTDSGSYQRDILDLLKKDDIPEFVEYVNLAG